MSTDHFMPSITPVPMREDRSEKAIWTATSWNARGTDGNSTYRPANDRRTRTSPSPAVLYGSKEIRFKSRYRTTLLRAERQRRWQRTSGLCIRFFWGNTIGREGGGIDLLQRKIGMPNELPLEPFARQPLIPQLNPHLVQIPFNRLPPPLH